MQFDIPDPQYTSSRRSQGNFMLAFKLTLGFLVVVWSVFFVRSAAGFEFDPVWFTPEGRHGFDGCGDHTPVAL